MLDWLIIGSGIHGLYLSIDLTRRRGVPADRLRLLDPHAQPLAIWERLTGNVGMAFLRSAHAHNLHFDPWSLATFARTPAGAPLARFIEPYGRPALDLFRAHCHLLIERYRLRDRRLIGRANGLTRLADGWRVEAEPGGIEARRVILAIGSADQPYWPDWARALPAHAPAAHIFAPGFDRAALPGWSRAVVIGGGITAAQTALTLAERAPGTVTLLMRHAPRIHYFDSDPVWIDPRQLAPFHAEADYSRRRAIIAQARHRGSMPPDVARALDAAVEHGALTVRLGEVTGAAWHPPHFDLALTDGDSLAADRVILATGFDRARPGGAWLDAAIADHALPVAPDGYPLLDATLCWGDGLFVTGPLAELEIGPTARNFIGVRLAAERIGPTVSR